MNVTKIVSTLCLGVGLAISMSSVSFAQDEELTRASLPEVCCEEDTCKITFFSGQVGIDPCRKLLANFIDPIHKDPSTGEFVENPAVDAYTCFSGNLGVNPNRTLWVNTICAVTDAMVDCDSEDKCPPSGCIDDPEGCVVIKNPSLEGRILVNGMLCPGSGCDSDPAGCIVIKNPVLDGKICLKGDFGSFGDCRDKFGVITNFIWPSVKTTDPTTGKESCKRDEQCGVTCFQGNAAINPCRELRTNYIIPVQKPGKSIDECCDADNCGTTTFRGNVGTDDCRMFLTNFICPTQNELDCDNYDPCGEKHMASPNVTGITNFSGDVGIDCRRKLLVNQIDPVRMRKKAGTAQTTCEEEGFCFLNSEVDSDTDAITCFSGNVGIDETKCLLVNRIGPVRPPSDMRQPGDECPDWNDTLDCPPLCEFDETGCLELHGAKVIIPNTLLVNDICPIKTKGAIDELSVMNLRSNVNIDYSLEVAGELILDGYNVGDVVAELQKAYAQVSAELAELRSILNN